MGGKRNLVKTITNPLSWFPQTKAADK